MHENLDPLLFKLKCCIKISQTCLVTHALICYSEKFYIEQISQTTQNLQNLRPTKFKHNAVADASVNAGAVHKCEYATAATPASLSCALEWKMERVSTSGGGRVARSFAVAQEVEQ